MPPLYHRLLRIRRLLRLHYLAWAVALLDGFGSRLFGLSFRGQWADSVVAVAPFLTGLAMLAFWQRLSKGGKWYFGAYGFWAFSCLLTFGIYGFPAPAIPVILAAAPYQSLGHAGAYEIRVGVGGGGLMGFPILHLVDQSFFWEQQVASSNVPEEFSGKWQLQSVDSLRDGTYSVHFRSVRGNTTLVFRGLTR